MAWQHHSLKGHRAAPALRLLALPASPGFLPSDPAHTTQRQPRHWLGTKGNARRSGWCATPPPALSSCLPQPPVLPSATLGRGWEDKAPRQLLEERRPAVSGAAGRRGGEELDSSCNRADLRAKSAWGSSQPLCRAGEQKYVPRRTEGDSLLLRVRVGPEQSGMGTQTPAPRPPVLLRELPALPGRFPCLGGWPFCFQNRAIHTGS